MTRKAAVRAWLGRRDAAFTVFASLAAFAAYSCMYGFRKPFTAAQFTGLEFFGMDYKTIVVIAQVFGYMLSKGIGIKVVSELTSLRRPVLMLDLHGRRRGRPRPLRRDASALERRLPLPQRDPPRDDLGHRLRLHRGPQADRHHRPRPLLDASSSPRASPRRSARPS